MRHVEDKEGKVEVKSGENKQTEEYEKQVAMEELKKKNTHRENTEL